MISFHSVLACQVTFPQPQELALGMAFSPAIVASTSNGWATQPWPGNNSWPMAPLVPSVLIAQVACVASTGERWLLSAWPGRGAWPFCFPSSSIGCQVRGQSYQLSLPSQIENFLAPGQTNLGSNNTDYCTRDFCTSGVYVEDAWMFKGLFSSAVFYLKAQKEIQAQALIPTRELSHLASQYILFFPVDNVDPFCQIYCSPQPLYFSDKVLRGQYWAERTRIIPFQYKKRPF